MSQSALTLFGDEIIVVRDPVAPTASKEYDNSKVFIITDMLFFGDKKRTWIEYRRLLSQGYSVDELLPIMWWGVKSVLHTKHGVAGIKPFVAGKITRGLPRLTPEQSIEIALSFLEMVVCARTVPRVSIESACEQWILTLPI